MSKTSPPEVYWTALRRTNLTPNFWMSREYAELAGLVWVVRGDLCGWVDPLKSEEWFLPPLRNEGFVIDQPTFAGFPGVSGDHGVFLDHQYEYDAHNFLNLQGAEWRLFRKNTRKFERDAEGRLIYRRLGERELEGDVSELLDKWAGGRKLQDPDTLVRFVLFGSRRWGLFQDSRLIGVNVADQNHRQALYRYCVDDGTPYLNECLRLCFYLSDWTQKRRWVNDGGDLGNQGLARFKQRLNPMRISDIFSYVPK